MDSNVTKDYANAYTEVISILDFVSPENINKIPKEKIKFYSDNMNKDYRYHIDFTKDFQEQEMSYITAAVLANLFMDYWANEEQKAAILRHEQQEYNKEETEKREKYNVNVFLNNEMESYKEKDGPEKINNDVVSNNQIIEQKESFIARIINKIKSLFKSK